MNLAKTAGSSSCKGQENGDASNESERPLKKARFAWQVKGKYHLKNDVKNTAKSTSIPSDPDSASSSGGASTNENSGEKENNLEILGDYFLKQDFNTLDSVYTPPDQTDVTVKPSISNEKLSLPPYVSSYEQNVYKNGLKRTSESCNDMKMVPMSMVVTQNFSEDQCIARWQAKQMVKSFVDNSINHILDFWIQEPSPPENEPSRFIALDVADFINNLPGDNSVENEGILMAISAHGLRNPGNSSSSREDHYLNNTHDSDCLYPLASVQSDDESHGTPDNSYSDTDTTNNNLDMSWTYSEDHKNESDDFTAFPLFPDTSLSYQDISHQNSTAECDGIHNPVDNDCDFLDAAILFAIQSKGLTTFGSDYG